MAYEILYDQELSYKYPVTRSHKRKRKALLLLFAAFAVLLAIPSVRYTIAEYLFPGDLYATKEAVAVLVEDLRQGVPVEDALVVFCREILYGS